MEKKAFAEITKKLFVRTHWFALIWVSYSYLMAGYGTVVLHQVYPLEELSQQAIIVIFGTIFLKVLENSFEHNDGGIFGHSVPMIRKSKHTARSQRRDC